MSPNAPVEMVSMRSPEGETKEVEGRPDVLVPMMAKGWTQVQPEQKGDA